MPIIYQAKVDVVWSAGHRSLSSKLASPQCLVQAQGWTFRLSFIAGLHTCNQLACCSPQTVVRFLILHTHSNCLLHFDVNMLLPLYHFTKNVGNQHRTAAGLRRGRYLLGLLGFTFGLALRLDHCEAQCISAPISLCTCLTQTSSWTERGLF